MSGMQSAVADGAANRVLQQLAQRAMRNDLQSAQNMQTALEAMGLLEDSAAPLSNPPAPAAPGNAAPEGGNNPPADPMDADRGRSEQLASASADPSHSISAPSTSRAGFATATMVARAAAAVAALEDSRPSQPSQAARGAVPAVAPHGACPTPLR